MHSVVRQCWIALPGAAIALAAMFCSANRAKAECGDYVRIGSDPMTQSMPLSHSGPAAPAEHPSCHRGQDIPLIPPTPAPVPASDLFCSMAFVSTPSLANSGWMDLCDLNDPVDFPSDIFHPPKPQRG
jgi:hypothetical protein